MGSDVHHRVQHRQQFVHTRGQRHLLGFPRSAQAFVERFDDGVVAVATSVPHVQDRSHLRAATVYGSSPAQGPAVAVERRDTDQCRERCGAQRPQLGDLRHQRPRRHRARRQGCCAGRSSVACHSATAPRWPGQVPYRRHARFGAPATRYARISSSIRGAHWQAGCARPSASHSAAAAAGAPHAGPGSRHRAADGASAAPRRQNARARRRRYDRSSPRSPRRAQRPAPVAG